MRWALFLACYATGGWEPGLAGLQALQRRTLDVDLLMVVAAIGAAAIGQIAEGALLIVIFATHCGAPHSCVSSPAENRPNASAAQRISDNANSLVRRARTNGDAEVHRAGESSRTATRPTYQNI